MPSTRIWQSAIMTIALGVGAVAPASADAPTNFDEHTLYSLSPEASKGNASLDVHRDGHRVHMAPSRDVPNQLWHIRKSDRDTWVLGSVLTGDCARLSVSRFGGNGGVEMRLKDRSRAQNWHIRLSANHQFVRLTSELRGPEFSLTAAGDPQGQDAVTLEPSQPSPQQRWTITPVRQVPGTGRCDQY